MLQTLLYSDVQNRQTLNTNLAIYKHFLPGNRIGNTVLFEDGLPDAFRLINHTVSRYYSINDTLPGVFQPRQLIVNGTAETFPIRMSVWFLDDDLDDELEPLSGILTESHPFGPLDVPGLLNFRDSSLALSRIELAFDLMTMPAFSDWESSLRKCMRHSVREAYDLGHRTGAYRMELQVEQSECHHFTPQEACGTLMFWTSLLLLLFSMWDMVLRFRVIQRWTSSRQHFPQFRRPNRFWLVFQVFADSVIFASSVESFLFMLWQDRVLSELRAVLQGSACMCAFFVLTSFFEHDSKRYLLFSTLRTCAPRLLSFMLGVLPLFLAYAFFGVCLFGRVHPGFGTLSAASTTLFAVICGDSIDATFNATSDGARPMVAILARVYMYTFVISSVYVCGNIFRVIVVDAYSVTWRIIAENQERHADALQRCYSAARAPDSPADGQESPGGAPSVSGAPEDSFADSEDPQYADLQPLVARVSGYDFPPLPGRARLHSADLIHKRLSFLFVGLMFVFVALSQHTNSVVRDTVSMLKEEFLPPDLVDDLQSFTSRLYSLDELVDWVYISVANFYELHTNMQSAISYHLGKNGTIEAPRMRVRYKRANGTVALTAPCDLIPDFPLGSLSTRRPRPHRSNRSSSLHRKFPKGQLREFLTAQPFTRDHTDCKAITDWEDKVQQIQIGYRLYTFGDDYCLMWHIRQLFDFRSRDGVVLLSLGFVYCKCPVHSELDLSELTVLFISVAILLCAAFDFTLRCYEQSRMMHASLWGRPLTRAPSQETLSHRLGWGLVLLLRDALLVGLAAWQVLFMVVLTNESPLVQDVHEVVRAAGAFLVCVSLLRYLEDYESVKVLAMTLRTATPITINFMAGAIPVFTAYSLFGTVVFGHVSWHFQTFNQTCVTLFSMINGDSLLDIFDAVGATSSALLWHLSRLYLFSFIALMIYGIGNIFLLIMEQAYTQGVGLAFDERRPSLIR
eukprot:EG_transcript_1508